MVDWSAIMLLQSNPVQVEQIYHTDSGYLCILCISQSMKVLIMAKIIIINLVNI